MSAVDPVPPSSPPTPGRAIADDLPCRNCAYNLRGLSLVGRCPECGIAVAISAGGDLLRYSHPAYVFKLRRGASFILAGVATVILGFVLVVAAVCAIATPRRRLANFLGNRFDVEAAALVLVATGGYCCALVGTWLMATPDPSGLGEAEYGLARRVIRISVVVGAGAIVLTVSQQSGRIAAVPANILKGLYLVSSLATLVGLTSQLRYLSRLAMRIPDTGLAQSADALMFALVICCGLLAASMGVTAAVSGGAPTVPDGISGILGTALLILFMMYVFLLRRLRGAIGQEAELALYHWATLASPASPPITPPEGNRR